MGSARCAHTALTRGIITCTVSRRRHRPPGQFALLLNARFAIRTGSASKLFAKDRAHVRRAAKPGFVGNRLELEIGCAEQLDGPVQPETHNLVVDCSSHRLLDLSFQYTSGKRNRPHDMVGANWLA